LEHRNREWHDKHRKIHSFGSIPQKPKVEEFKAIYGQCQELDQFLASENWLEVIKTSSSTASLADLRVPGPHSFIASGTLNHNSGKSVGAEHKMVRHCYENWDALGLIITPSIRTGKFGVIHDLETLVLPAWEEGIGLEWIPSKLDPNTKDRVMKVANRHGGWSTVLQIAIPYAEAIASRIKGIHPSYALADELTDCEGREYLRLVSAQLNRRRHIQGPQQYVGTCNPKGPSNWVYKAFFEEPVNHETGVRDPAFSVYHVPFRENSHRPEMRSYLENLERAVRDDPIERARLIEGKWVERPTGDALFRARFIPQRHVVGNARLGTGLRPKPGLPCTIGYDLGQVYSTAIFEQLVPTKDGAVWMVFDEVCHLNEKILYKVMAIEIVEKILMWNKFIGQKMAWEHIADDSAVNQWRPGSGGSYDAWEFQSEFNRAILINNLPPMTMVGCPKGDGSVETRVRLTQGLLQQDRLLISDQCHHVKEMLNMLEEDKAKPLRPKKTVAGHIHVFDGLSYPILKYELGGTVSGGPAVSAVHTH